MILVKPATDCAHGVTSKRRTSVFPPLRLRQTSAGKYNRKLRVEFFAVGQEIHGDKYVLLDRQESSFTPSKDNDGSHEFSGRSVEIPDFTFDEIRRGEKPHGYLVTVSDPRGEISAHKESSAWLYEILKV